MAAEKLLIYERLKDSKCKFSYYILVILGYIRYRISKFGSLLNSSYISFVNNPDFLSVAYLDVVIFVIYLCLATIKLFSCV